MYKRYFFDELSSTNDYLKEHSNNYDNYTCVYTAYQSQGKGRMNRSWQAEKNKNIMMSILVKDFTGIVDIAQIALVAAASVHKILISIVPNVVIKWPNDLLINRKKICGILVEAISYGAMVDALVIGIGVNINQINFDDFLVSNTTSLCLETNQTFDLKMLIEVLHKQLVNDLEAFKKDNLDAINYVRENLFAKGEKIIFSKNNNLHEGILLDINNEGDLIVIFNDKITTVKSGEIKIVYNS